MPRGCAFLHLKVRALVSIDLVDHRDAPFPVHRLSGRRHKANFHFLADFGHFLTILTIFVNFFDLMICRKAQIWSNYLSPLLKTPLFM